jgi:WD40 repeat protein
VAVDLRERWLRGWPGAGSNRRPSDFRPLCYPLGQRRAILAGLAGTPPRLAGWLSSRGRNDAGWVVPGATDGGRGQCHLAESKRWRAGQVESSEPGQSLPIWGTPSARSPDVLPIVVCGGDDAVVRVWDLESRQLLHEPLKAHDGKINAVAVGSLRGRPIAVSAGSDRTLRVWDLVSGQSVGAPLEGHRRKVRAVAVGEFRERPIVVSGSNDNTVRVWDVDSGRLLYEPFVGHQGNVTSVAVGELNGGAIAVSGSEDFTLRVWDLEVGRPLGALQGHEGFVFAVALGELGGRPIAVSGGDDKTVRVWALDNGEALGTPLRGHRDWVTAVAVGALGGRPIAVSGGTDQMIRVWDLEKAAPVGEPLAGHEGWVNAVAVATIGDRSIAVSGDDNSVRVWGLDAGAPLGWPLWQDSSVNAVAMAEIPGTPQSTSTVSPGATGEPSVRLSVQPPVATAGEQITCRFEVDTIDVKVRGGHVDLGYYEVHYQRSGDGRGSPIRVTEWVSVATAELFSGGLESGPQVVQLVVPKGAPPTDNDAIEWRVHAVIDRRLGRDARATRPLIVQAARP